MKNLIPFIFVIIFTGNSFGQLDPLYNQYQFNQSMINPAYTGIHDVFNASLISRFQWIGIDGAPQTNTLNLTSSFAKNEMGMGLILTNDNYGVNNNTDIQFLYSYRINMLQGRVLSFGVQGGMLSYKHSYDLLNTETFDPNLNQNTDDFTRANFGTGVFFMSRDYYIGLSVPRILNTETISINNAFNTRYKRHFYLSGGYVFDNLMPVKFKPSFLIKFTEQRISYDLNAQVLLVEALWLGLTVRDFNALGLTSQFEINNQFRLGYSFEYPLNSLKSQTLGSHEFMLSMDLELFDRQARGRRYF